MHITRRIHSCIEITEDSTRLVIDPGSFGAPDNLDQATAILITHVHPDHVDVDKLSAAREKNPDLPIYGTAELADLTDLVYTQVSDGDTFTVGSIEVAAHFFQHVTITHSTPLPENLGFIFNNRVLHPGDSYPDLPGMELALVPVSAPWMRMLNVDDYLKANRPQQFIGIHDVIDNENGVALRGNLLRKLAEEHGVTYHGLRPDESLEI